jgi:hypothetical protein
MAPTESVPKELLAVIVKELTEQVWTSQRLDSCNSLPPPLPFPLGHQAYMHPIGTAVPAALQGLTKTAKALQKEASLPDKLSDPGYR